jgi:bla regulator protein BlaR1
MGAGRQIPLLMSQKLMEPGMFGIFRPVLIWPERLSERLDDEHIEAILAHELRHAQRKDNLTAVLHMVVEAAFWFSSPGVVDGTADGGGAGTGVRRGGSGDGQQAGNLCGEPAQGLPVLCGVAAGVCVWNHGADLSKRVLSIMTLRLERMGVAKKVALALFGLIVIATPILLGQSEEGAEGDGCGAAICTGKRSDGDTVRC